MKIVEKLGKKPVFSFEFFPPKDAAGVDRLFETIAELKPYQPAYVSVTYGAGGSTRRLTVELVRRIKREAGIEAMAHLTCVGATREELLGVLDELAESGVENVIALRGDPPRGQTSFVRTEGGFGNAVELVRLARSRHDFCLAAACYPEKHPEAPDAETDLARLKVKVDAGAEFLITQLFFDNQDYFRFVERARAIGIDVPIVAGIMPVTNLSQIKRFTALCGACIPAPLLEKLERAGADESAVRAIGVDYATAQCRELLERGVLDRLR
jgi:methylenetetrahydrofolate reductase (NADPH)